MFRSQLCYEMLHRVPVCLPGTSQNGADPLHWALGKVFRSQSETVIGGGMSDGMQN